VGTASVGGNCLSYVLMKALWFNFGIMLIPAQTYFPGPRLHGRLPCFRPHESLHVNTLSTCHQHVAQAICERILRHVALAELWLISGTMYRVHVSLHFHIGSSTRIWTQNCLHWKWD
jgi:hypothetical protein